MPLASFLGPDGLSYALSFLSVGPLLLSERGGATSSPVRDADAYVDFVRRVQIPGYEQARARYRDSDVQEDYSDANESLPYRQDTITRILGSAPHQS